MATLRQSRRLKAHASARLQQARAYSEHMHALHTLEDEFDDEDRRRLDRACRGCDGAGREDCPVCGGTALEGW